MQRGKRLRALCREKGLAFRGMLQVVMPENYIALFNAPEAPEARRIVAAAQPVLEAGAGCHPVGAGLPRSQGRFDRQAEVRHCQRRVLPVYRQGQALHGFRRLHPLRQV